MHIIHTCVFQEGDGEMEMSSLPKARASCHPFELVSCWRWERIVSILNYWGCPRLFGRICPQDVLWCLFSVTAAIPAMLLLEFICLFLLIPPPAPPRRPHPTCPTPTVNYCFDSRAKSCSKCLQAGKGCAYCTEEVRAQNGRNEPSKNKVVGKMLLLEAQYWPSK